MIIGSLFFILYYLFFLKHVGWVLGLHPLWPHFMASFHGFTSWLHFMISFHGFISWLHFMASFHGLISWLHFMASFHGFISWPYFMASFHSFISWFHFMASFHVKSKFHQSEQTYKNKNKDNKKKIRYGQKLNPFNALEQILENAIFWMKNKLCLLELRKASWTKRTCCLLHKAVDATKQLGVSVASCENWRRAQATHWWHEAAVGSSRCPRHALDCFIVLQRSIFLHATLVCFKNL